MKELNQEKVSQTITFLKQAIEINANTDHSVDVDLMGNWNQVEIRVYDSKAVPLGNNLLFESYDLQGESYDDEEKIDTIKTVLNNLTKSLLS